jgi:hypothetical protein
LVSYTLIIFIVKNDEKTMFVLFRLQQIDLGSCSLASYSWVCIAIYDQVTVEPEKRDTVHYPFDGRT